MANPLPVPAKTSAAASNQVDQTYVPPALETWRDFRSNRTALTGLMVVIVLALLALAADWLAPHAPNLQFRDALLTPPFWAEGGSLRFPLGTDDLGRDILSRLMHGARLSLMIGLAVVVLALSVGVLLGLLAGFFPGIVDTGLMRCMDIMLALPALLLAIVIVAILGPSLVNAMIAVSTLPFSSERSFSSDSSSSRSA